MQSPLSELEYSGILIHEWMALLVMDDEFIIELLYSEAEELLGIPLTFNIDNDIKKHTCKGITFL